MLPDYPQIKAELKTTAEEFMQFRFRQYLGPLAGIPEVRVFEGNSKKHFARTGGSHESPMMDITAEMNIHKDDLPTRSLSQHLGDLDSLAKDMAYKMSTRVYQGISKAVDDAGNVVSTQGIGFRPDALLEAMAKVAVEFEQDGTPRMPSFHVGEQNAEALRNALQEIDRDPEMLRRHSDIMKQKREEWRAREASRRLVG